MEKRGKRKVLCFLSKPKKLALTSVISLGDPFNFLHAEKLKKYLAQLQNILAFSTIRRL